MRMSQSYSFIFLMVFQEVGNALACMLQTQGFLRTPPKSKAHTWGTNCKLWCPNRESMLFGVAIGMIKNLAPQAVEATGLPYHTDD